MVKMGDHCHAKIVVRLVSLSVIMTTFLHVETLAFRSVMSTARSIQVCTNTTCRKVNYDCNSVMQVAMYVGIHLDVS